MVDVQIARQLTEQVSRLRQRQTAPLILELDLTDGISEGPVTDPLSAIMARRRLKLTDVIEGLRRARQDDRVRALVVKLGGGRIGLARMQDIRGAVTGSVTGTSPMPSVKSSSRISGPFWRCRSLETCSVS